PGPQVARRHRYLGEARIERPGRVDAKTGGEDARPAIPQLPGSVPGWIDARDVGSRDGKERSVGLRTRHHRPQHLAVVVDVDVLVDDDGAFEAIGAERRERGVHTLALDLFVNLHVDQIARTARRHVDRLHARRQLLQLTEDDALHAQREQGHVLGADVEDVVEDRVAPMRDRRHFEDACLPRWRVIQPVVAERSVLLTDPWNDAPLDDDLRVGRDRDVDGFGGHDADRLTQQPAHDIQLERATLTALL